MVNWDEKLADNQRRAAKIYVVQLLLWDIATLLINVMQTEWVAESITGWVSLGLRNHIGKITKVDKYIVYLILLRDAEQHAASIILP